MNDMELRKKVLFSILSWTQGWLLQKITSYLRAIAADLKFH